MRFSDIAMQLIVVRLKESTSDPDTDVQGNGIGQGNATREPVNGGNKTRIVAEAKK